MRFPSRTTVAAVGLAAVCAALLSVPGVAAARITVGEPPMVRVNQVGYPETGAKIAFVMLSAPARSVSFALEGPHGSVYLAGRSTDDLGFWSSRYRAVFEISFSRFEHPGTYRIALTAPARAVSPIFRIASPQALYTRLVTNGVRYFTSERDGGNVVSSVLHRQPANLTDRSAIVYADPRYDKNDNLLGKFHKIGGPVDVSGGWFDAGGGYEKFAYTASFADALLLMAERNAPGRYPALMPEAQFGLRWTGRLFDPVHRVMYVQVGIGNGNASNTIEGDYNFWFLPQREDHMGAKPGDPGYYVEYRPVFEAAPPGKPVSPDLAGRFAADFALGAQLDTRTDPPEAAYLLAEAREVYGLAQTTNVRSIVTTFPHDYYPGSEWKSDMLWGATEIALADAAVRGERHHMHADLETAARWARAYIKQGHPAGGDTFNLYDNGAVAEGDLLKAMREAGGAPVIAPGSLLADLAAQLKVGEAWAKGDPFGLGTQLGASDAAPHAFGLYTTNAIYQEYGGSDAYRAFAQEQMNFALGANAWGSSFVVGAGSTFPHCMQSEIANLAGSLTGHGDIQLGATTDGPSSLGNFKGLGTVPGMKACSVGGFKMFDNNVAGYEDNVVSWPSVEPADDYSAGSLLAFSYGAAGPAA
ncbi:MAG TPA: glycoside hydrolase family 9 protein [Streptosporangiaceae bacterium]|nr:glycoside hydrolase family 9 protein [Streptosporangiaceae bacterium]